MKGNKAIYKAKNDQGNTPVESNGIILEFIELEAIRYSEEYRRTLIDTATQVVVGGMYFFGSSRDEVYILDDVIRTESSTPKGGKKGKKGKKATSFLYSCKVRVWDWKKREWGPRPGRGKGYEYEIELREFLEYVSLPKLTKLPDELYREAEAALERGDVASYQLQSHERADIEGAPETQLIHPGSKEAVELIHQDLVARKNHAELIATTMTMIIEEKQRALEKIREQLTSAIVVFEKKIKKIKRVITTLELYVGIGEEIVQILEGPTAPAADPVCIRQAIMFMDEEVGSPGDDGQGLEWRDMEDFGEWLIRNGNYKLVLPESKCIAAFKARRTRKHRHPNPYVDMHMGAVDDKTFVVMRNGDNVYRLITDKINFMPRLFPRRTELQQLFNVWIEADKIENQERERDRKALLGESEFKTQAELDQIEKELASRDYGQTYLWSDNKLKSRLEAAGHDTDSYHRHTGDIKEHADDHVFFYRMRFTLFQGILERTQIFQPTLKPIRLFDSASIDEGLVRLIYDDELTLPSGRLPFWEWLERVNSTIDFGSRIVLSHNWGFISSFKSGEDPHLSFSEMQENKLSRLDDRFQNVRRSLPADPPPGLYYVRRGTRGVMVPIWEKNPWFRPDLYVTDNEEEYRPEQYKKEFPRTIKAYYSPRESRKYRSHVVPIRMDESTQVKTFGKVVSPAESIHYEPTVYVLKNPTHLHVCTWVVDQGWDSERQRMVDIPNSKSPEFSYEKQEAEFMCIRYNPKDVLYYDGWSYRDEPTERKTNLSWKITRDDAFIVNYDVVTLDDIEFYINSRVDRGEYLHMMPLLDQIKKQLLVEAAEEEDFKKLVSGEVFKKTGTLPSDQEVASACERWKKDLKWKRAIAHDDQKALRMIVSWLAKGNE